MTRDQMHNTLRYVREQLADERGSDFSGVEALDIVIAELEQEPSGDLISRQAVEDALYEYSENNDVNYNLIITEYIDTIPPVEQEPCEKDWRFYYDHGYAQAKRDLSCEDAISRQAVLNVLFYKSDNNSEVRLSKELQDRIKNLPPVNTQKPKKPCNTMDFSSTFDEFAKEYGFTDTEQIYTNGSELIPIFRVKQWLEHIEPKAGHWVDGLTAKVLEEVDGGTDDTYIRYTDICNRVEKSIREYCGARMRGENE